jgi:short-subunit dehydrogenase
LIVSSMAGLTPIAFQTVYSATKAFLAHFGCALAHELEGENVSVTVFAPGGIITEMTSTERFKPLTGWLMPVERCARDGLNGFIGRKYLHVPGFLYRVGNAFLGFLPRRFVASRVAATYRTAVRNTVASLPTPPPA